MRVLNKIAFALGRKDEEPNVLLAADIIKSKDKKAIKELIEGLHKRNKNIQSDCIKVLDEVGERKPELILPYKKEFLALLHSKNNRMVWGAMTALDAITSVNPSGIYNNISLIAQAADHGSVIAKDHYVRILARLAKDKKYKPDALVLLLNQLMVCATNQLPMYCEISATVVDKKNAAAFIKVIEPRLHEPATDHGKKRIEKVLKQLTDKLPKRKVVK